MKRVNFKKILIILMFNVLLIQHLLIIGCEAVKANDSSIPYESIGNDIDLKEENLEKNLQNVTSDSLSLSNLQIYSKVALLYDNTYDKILFEKNIDEKVHNASTTKVLTSIVAYENSDMEAIVTVSQKAATVGGSTIGLKKGDKIKMEDLMKGLLICSGNDAAVAIAEYVGGSVENFASMMNKKAKELGATSTNFVTPHGLDDDMHYTTARDLLIFSKYLLRVPFLAQIVNTSNITININGYSKEIRTTNEMLSIYPEANGIKTGYTGKAGRCLITSIDNNGRNLIIIVLGCDTKKQRTEETKKLINYGYKAYEIVNIYEKMRKNFNINIDKTVAKNYEICIAGDKKILLKMGEKDGISYKYKIFSGLIAPIEKGAKLGEIVVNVDGIPVDKLEIKSPIRIERKKMTEYIKELLKNQVMYVLVNN